MSKNNGKVTVDEHLKSFNAFVAAIPMPGRSRTALNEAAKLAYEKHEPLVAVKGNFQINGVQVNKGDLITLPEGAGIYRLIEGGFFIDQGNRKNADLLSKANILKETSITPAKGRVEATRQDVDKTTAYILALSAELEKAKGDLVDKNAQRAKAETALEAALVAAEQELV